MVYVENDRSKWLKVIILDEERSYYLQCDTPLGGESHNGIRFLYDAMNFSNFQGYVERSDTVFTLVSTYLLPGSFAFHPKRPF